MSSTPAWFAQTEAQFARQEITTDAKKHGHWEVQQPQEWQVFSKTHQRGEEVVEKWEANNLSVWLHNSRLFNTRT